MEGFKLSPDCMIEKSSKAIARELMKGSFVVGCDYKNKQLILENVFITQPVRTEWRFTHYSLMRTMKNVN